MSKSSMQAFADAIGSLPTAADIENWGRLMLASESMAEVVRAGLEGERFGEFSALFERVLRDFDYARDRVLSG